LSANENRFQQALVALARARVAFVIVDVGGINFYAREPGDMVHTLDLDVLLEPSVENLRAALAALQAVGFSFAAADEPFVDSEDDVILGNLIRTAASLSAHHPAGAQLDLMLEAAGFRYEELARDAETFRIGEFEARVGVSRSCSPRRSEPDGRRISSS
jgi:hypothetical protein